MKAATATCCPSHPEPEGHRRSEDIALHRQLGILLAQPDQLRALVLAQDPVTAVRRRWSALTQLPKAPSLIP